jgi:hypothetical protein
MNSLQQLLDFLARLDSSQIQYRLECVRDAIMVVVPSPSKYFEIEFFADGAIEMQTYGPQSLVKSVGLDEMAGEVIQTVNAG